MAHTVWDIDLGGNTISQVRSTGYNDSAQVIYDRLSGDPTPAALYLGNIEPTATLSSGDIAGLLALNAGTFAAAGLCINNVTTTVPLAKRADCATIAAGAVHAALAGEYAIAIPQSFEVRQDSEEGATASFEVRFRLDPNGVILTPLVPSTTATLAAAVFQPGFGLGKAFINSVELSECVGITVNPGITVVAQYHSGNNYASAYFFTEINPTIDFLMEDLGAAMSYVPSFGSSTSCIGYFRRRLDGGTYVPDATTDHVSFSFAAGLVRADAMDAQTSGNGSATIRCFGKSLATATGIVIP